MRDYGKVHTTFWSSKTIRGLSEDGRTLAIYLLTSPHSSIAGAFRLPDGYACEDLNEERLGWTPERVAKGFRELFENGFANRCGTTKWVWICDHFEWNSLDNPNQRKAAQKIADSIPDECAWKADFLRKSGPIMGMTDAEIMNRLETLPKPFANQDQEQKQEQKQEQESQDNIVEFGNRSRGFEKGLDLNLELQEPSAQNPKAERRAAAERIFEHWKATHGHERAQLDEKRLKLIYKALDAGYGESDLCQAITGYLNSPHHMGENDRNTKYDSIELMLRGAKYIDQGLKFYAEPPRTERSRLMRRNLTATAGWVPPEMRNAAK